MTTCLDAKDHEVWVERNRGSHPVMPRYSGLALHRALSVARDLHNTGLFRRVEVWTSGGAMQIVEQWVTS